jgi:hypothetical protein
MFKSRNESDGFEILRIRNDNGDMAYVKLYAPWNKYGESRITKFVCVLCLILQQFSAPSSRSNRKTGAFARIFGSLPVLCCTAIDCVSYGQVSVDLNGYFLALADQIFLCRCDVVSNLWHPGSVAGIAKEYKYSRSDPVKFAKAQEIRARVTKGSFLTPIGTGMRNGRYVEVLQQVEVSNKDLLLFTLPWEDRKQLMLDLMHHWVDCYESMFQNATDIAKEYGIQGTPFVSFTDPGPDMIGLLEGDKVVMLDTGGVYLDWDTDRRPADTIERSWKKSKRQLERFLSHGALTKGGVIGLVWSTLKNDIVFPGRSLTELVNDSVRTVLQHLEEGVSAVARGECPLIVMDLLRVALQVQPFDAKRLVKSLKQSRASKDFPWQPPSLKYEQKCVDKNVSDMLAPFAPHVKQSKVGDQEKSEKPAKQEQLDSDE